VDKRLPGDADHVAGDQDLAPVEVNVEPAQRAQLATPGAEHHGQTQEQAQLRILRHRRRQ
jgi:hypothetical protein